jgi:hypothetical protein
MDGLQGLEYGPIGMGPGNYDSDLEQMMASQKNMRLILAGRDPVALDAIAGLVMHHDPQLTNHLVYLHNHGYGIVDPARIELVGVRVPDVRKNFELDNPNGASTKYTKTICDDYGLDFWFGSDSLYLSVPDPTDLARLQVSVDGQKIDKYIVGSFDGVSLSLENINVSSKMVSVIFKDRYLNERETLFTHTGLSDPWPGREMTKVFPNPASSLLTVAFSTENPGELTLLILDVSGKVHYTETLYPIPHDETIIPLNIGHLPEGSYYIRISRNRDLISNSPFIKY